MAEIKKCAYKYCIVPMCRSTTVKNHNKVFFRVPNDMNARKKWCKLMRRDLIGPKSTKYVCEDHFDVENDTENLVKYRLIGGTLKLKPDVCPHKFECQATKSETEQGAFEKRRRIEFYEMPSTSSQSSPFQSFGMIECDKIELNETEDPLPEDITFTESVPDNHANQKRKKRAQKEDFSPSGNEYKVFCPKCNTEVQHTAEGIQEDQTKILVAKVYHYFECEYEELKKLYGAMDLTPLSKFRQRTALATGVSETTVLQILQEEEERNAEKLQEKKRSIARKRSMQTESSSGEESSDDNVGDGAQPSYGQEAQTEAAVETLVVKMEPECDKDQGQSNTILVEVKAEPPDDDVNYTNETLALTEPAATKRKGRKIPRSDVTSTWQHKQGESSTSAASSSVLLTDVLDKSGLPGGTDIKVEEIEIGDEEFR